MLGRTDHILGPVSHSRLDALATDGSCTAQAIASCETKTRRQLQDNILPMAPLGQHRN